MVFLYCFLRLNLKTRILAARSAPTIVPVTLPPETSSPPSLKDALTASSISEPMSPASFSTRITSPGATRYCFPPVSMIACMQTSDWEPEHTECVGTAGVKNQCTTSPRLVQIGWRGHSLAVTEWNTSPMTLYRMGYRPLAVSFGLSLCVATLLAAAPSNPRSEEHTSELQSLRHLVCRL